MFEFDRNSIDCSSAAGKVLEYNDIVVRLVQAAKDPGFGVERWKEREALVAPDDFRRVVANGDERTWSEDVAMLHDWAKKAEFTNRVRRIREVGNLVYLDVEENVSMNGQDLSVNTLAVYEFNDAGKILQVTSYQQRAA